MTEKRFRLIDYEEDYFTVGDDEKGEEYDTPFKIVDVLNELNDEKEDWKNNCLKSVSENSILWNEISILREQGAEPSDAFKKYLESISTEHTKFWQRKLEKAKKDGVIE